MGGRCRDVISVAEPAGSTSTTASQTSSTICVRVAANEVRLSLCELQRDTLDAGLQRFDASDHMPVAIGGDSLGDAFMQGMLDYIAQGPDSLDEVLADIEEARREVMAQTDP